MIERFINNSSYNFDRLFRDYDWLNSFAINEYPLLAILINLLLLAVPFYAIQILIALWKKTGFKNATQKITASAIFFIWMLFIPNTAYIITDVRYLLNYCPSGSLYSVCPENAWMIIFFFAYALIGWVSFVYLIRQMKDFIFEFSGANTAKLFICLVIPLISLGVLIGMINRWNSWEFLISPLPIMKNMLDYFTNMVYFKDWVIFTLGLYVLYYLGKNIFKKNFINKNE